MNEVNNATCCICGKGYHVCKSCKDSMALNPWKMYTDTSEHYKIYQIIRGFNIKLYDKKEAKERLQKVDLSDIDGLRDHIKELILEIMAEPVQEAQSEIVHSDVVEEPEFAMMQRAMRKRKSSKVVDTE